jgi:hypothetical protein
MAATCFRQGSGILPARCVCDPGPPFEFRDVTFMYNPIMHAKTSFNRIEKTHLDQRRDSLAASPLPLKKKLDFFYRIAFQHTVFRVMAGAMTPEPDGQHFRSRAELADETSRLDVGEVVDVQIEIGHGGTFQDENEIVDGRKEKSAGESERASEDEDESEPERASEDEDKRESEPEPERAFEDERASENESEPEPTYMPDVGAEDASMDEVDWEVD